MKTLGNTMQEYHSVSTKQLNRSKSTEKMLLKTSSNQRKQKSFSVFVEKKRRDSFDKEMREKEVHLSFNLFRNPFEK